MSQNSILTFCLLSVIFLYTSPLLGQELDKVDLNQLIQETEQFIFSNKNEEALLLLQPYLKQLSTLETLRSSTALKLRFLQAKALQQSNQDKAALQLLKELLRRSQEAEVWEVYGNTNLELARLYQKNYRSGSAKKHLALAKSAIQAYQLDSLQASLKIRYAFWHNTFGYPDSASYYADEAIETLDPVSDLQNELDLYFLLGFSAARTDFPAAVGYYEKAVRVAKNLKDYLATSTLYYQLAFLYSQNRQFDQELLYTDSSIVAAYRAIEAGQERIYILGEVYDRKAHIFKRMGQLDSAFIYIKKAKYQSLLALKQQQKEQIFEIDARFNDEQKDLLLDQQNLEIRWGLQVRYLLIGIIVLVLAIAMVLIRSHFAQLRINQKIKEQADQLQKLDQMKSRFFTNVSHELRTPLTLIMGPLQSLQKYAPTTEKQKKLLSLAHHNGKKMEQLIKEILDLQKMTLGKLKLYPQTTILNNFFLTHLAQFEALAGFKNIEYTYQTNFSTVQKAKIDREKYRQILYNLLSNAFKYTPSKGQVKVGLFLENDQLHLQVSDTGKGIPAGDLPYIFDRYFQSREMPLSNSGGTGVGLAICKEYTELMGGQIEVESQVEVGTNFQLSFPVELVHLLLEEQTNEQKPLQLEIPNPLYSIEADLMTKDLVSKVTKKQKLLLVEDNPELQVYLRLILSDQYKLTFAQNGQEALNILAESTYFDLILSDLMMPILDGYQLLEELKAHETTRYIPTLILTARADMASKLQALRTGVDDYLLKPFNDLELKTRIQNLLHNQAQRQELMAEQLPPTEPAPSDTTEDQVWLSTFEAYLQSNLSNELLTVSKMASHFSMSNSTLFRKVKGLTGLSPKQYFQEVRLQNARQELERNHKASIAAISERIGYQDVRSFSRLYKKRFGKLPSEY